MKLSDVEENAAAGIRQWLEQRLERLTADLDKLPESQLDWLCDFFDRPVVTAIGGPDGEATGASRQFPVTEDMVRHFVYMQRCMKRAAGAGAGPGEGEGIHNLMPLKLSEAVGGGR